MFICLIYCTERSVGQSLILFCSAVLYWQPVLCVLFCVIFFNTALSATLHPTMQEVARIEPCRRTLLHIQYSILYIHICPSPYYHPNPPPPLSPILLVLRDPILTCPQCPVSPGGRGRLVPGAPKTKTHFAIFVRIFGVYANRERSDGLLKGPLIQGSSDLKYLVIPILVQCYSFRTSMYVNKLMAAGWNTQGIRGERGLRPTKGQPLVANIYYISRCIFNFQSEVFL